MNLSDNTKSILKNTGSARYTIFPIKYNKLWEFYEKHLSLFWTPQEVKLTDDIIDWNNNLNESEKYFIKNILAFFASSDGIVNENLVLNFYNEIQIPEARSFYSIQMLIETIHATQYSLLIDTYISDKYEKQRLFNAMETIPCVQKKAQWAIKWIENGTTYNEMLPDEIKQGLLELSQNQHLSNSNINTLDFFLRKRPSLSQRLIAFICVEGIFFSGSFCAIYWLKNRGLMPGLSTANEYIARDENQHVEFTVELFKLLESESATPLTQDIVHNIFKEAIDIEKEFITQSLPVSLIGMNCILMSQYIEYVADRWLILLGFQKIHPLSTNPFNFMDMIGMNSKTNFFEVLNTSYVKSNTGASKEDLEIAFDSDF